MVSGFLVSGGVTVLVSFGVLGLRCLYGAVFGFYTEKPPLRGAPKNPKDSPSKNPKPVRKKKILLDERNDQLDWLKSLTYLLA